MDNGWIKLWRKSFDSIQWKNEGLWRLWTYCLLRANHKEKWVTVRTGKGETEVKILPGQFIYGRNSAAKDLKWNPSSTYKRMEKLKKLEKVDIQSNTHYSIVTIINWGTYQDLDEFREQPKEHPSNTQVTPKEQPSNTNKNVKNEKNEKNVKKIYKAFSPPDIKMIQDYCLERNNNVDPERWFDFYSSKGWMIGKNKMKDWKAAVRTWEKNGKTTGNAWIDEQNRMAEKYGGVK